MNGEKSFNLDCICFVAIILENSKTNSTDSHLDSINVHSNCLNMSVVMS